MDHPLDTVFGPAGPGVIFRDFDDEMVVANLDTGIFFSLCGGAPRIWTAMLAGHTGRQIAAACGDADQALAAADIAALLQRLQAEALIAPSPTPPAMPAPLAAITFTAPVIERFDDLQGLLLVDPIHDVSEAGWPAIAPAASLAS